MSEFDELYEKGDMVWVDADGKEWVPAHEYAALKRELARERETLVVLGNKISEYDWENAALKRETRQFALQVEDTCRHYHEAGSDVVVIEKINGLRSKATALLEASHE